tara:strand:+ start:35 stop:520 length:486 start_codon:yes stop_codon:yes gene_type:complete
MAVPITLPSVPAVPADTIIGQKCLFGFEESGGSQENIRGKVGSLSSTIDKVERKAVDATSGLVETDRTVVIGVKWTLRITVDEFSTALMAYINDPYRAGVGRLWIEDPDDIANVVSLLSNEFNCTCSPDGDMTFQVDQFSEASIVVDINGTFTLSKDGATI